ncbi:catalase [Bacillus anthracis]|uniref:catalase n=2 Tax=Bacillales TaxID=1385 RepID=UPI0012AE821E|nr:catalase [Bacillus anthracis]MRS10814.1 catalase [Bacillus anthracis]
MNIKQSFKLLAMFLSVLFVLFPLQKAFAEVMDHTKYQMDWSYSKSKKKPIRTELIKTADGKIAFCLNVDLKSPSGQDLPEMGKVDINVYRVLLNGYPQKSPQELGVSDWREAHYATQLAVWNALKQIDINDLDFRNKNVEKVTKDIVAKASASDELQEITMSVTPTEEQEAVLKNDFFETGLYTVETNAKSGTYKVQATGAPTGAKFVNEKGEAVLVKYHWEPKQGIRNLTQEDANSIQAMNVSHATQDLYEAIERKDYPEWELFVQIMEDGYHPELDFDPLDDTKLWPEEQFPWLPVGRMVLDRNPVDYHSEIEQAAFGTGVLVDGMDFSDDKMLQGRTFSYSDTQRYRVGANYLQLPVNAPKAPVRTNQHRGQMDMRNPKESGENPHINYEPSMLGGYKDAKQEKHHPHQPTYNAAAMSAPIDRPNNYGQAGHTYRSFEEWERNELVKNLSEALAVCDKRIQNAMIAHFTQADEDYGRRVKEGIEKKMKEAKTENKLPGREVSKSKYGQGSLAANEATKDAVKKSHESDPY